MSIYKAAMRGINEKAARENELKEVRDMLLKMEAKNKINADEMKSIVALLGGVAFFNGFFDDQSKRSDVAKIASTVGGAALLTIIDDLLKRG